MRAKKILAALMAVLILSITLCVPVFCVETGEADRAANESDMPDISGVGSAWLYCLDTDSVILKEGADLKMFPAGTVKLMTAIVARSFIKEPTKSVTLKSEISVATPSKTYNMKEGDTVTGDDLFKLMLMQNSNEAANALARLCCESVSDFVVLMNAKAKELGMSGTLYANATGVDYMGQYTTASDVGILLREFWNDQYLAKISDLANVRLSQNFGSSMIYSRNFLCSSYYNSGQNYTDSSVMAGISTSTPNAGYCLAAVKEYKGKLYMCVMMAGTSSNGKISTYELLPKIVSWGGDSFTYVSVLNKWTAVGELKIKHGLGYDHASVFCRDNVYCYIEKSVDPKVDIKYEYEINEKQLTAPISAGHVVGSAKAYYKGELIASTDIVIVNSIARNESSVLSTRIVNFLTSRGFIIACVIFVIVFVVYVLCMAKYRAYKQRVRRSEAQR